MKRLPALTLASIALASAALVSVPTAAAAAAPAVVSGKLESGAVKLPASASAGEAQVTALSVDTGAYGDAARVTRSGRFALELPAGKWVLQSSVVALGEPYASFLSARIVTRPGQRRALPLTLKKFKKPRRKRRKGKHRHPPKRGAHAANVNPRDGQAYPGEAISLRYFDVSGDPELGVLRKGMADMLITDLAKAPECEYTIIEWERRDTVLKEIEFAQTKWVDPSSGPKPGHLIDPEIFVRGKVEERPGTPRRLALIGWLEDAKTGARVSDEFSVVDLYDQFFVSQTRFSKLVMREICARANAAPITPGAAPPPRPPPKPVANKFAGTFSGTADAFMQHWEWSGQVQLDAAQDSSMPPHGAPPGSYRLFSITAGGMDVQTTGGDASCGWQGSGHIDLEPGFANGSLWVQVDTPTPAYYLSFRAIKFITVQRTGTECSGTAQVPMPEPWALTEKAHISPTTTLEDSEAHITPEGYDFDYTTRWSLAPG